MQSTNADARSKWDRVPGVTLPGDAAHPMPPSGDGANPAMFDGVELGKAIAAHPDDVETAIGAYEEAAFRRGETFSANAREILDLCLGDRALRTHRPLHRLPGRAARVTRHRPVGARQG